MMTRTSPSLPRRSFLTAMALAPLARPARAALGPKRLLLRSSWQTVNIGDIAHTPGMLALLETHLPDVEVTLWPSSVADGVEALLLSRFPKLKVAKTAGEKDAALRDCDAFLHGSGPGLVGLDAMRRWAETGKPYGVGGVTLSDAEITTNRELLSKARFVSCRDTDSLRAMEAGGVRSPIMDFGPDATFALDLRDDDRAEAVLREKSLTRGDFLCVVPRLRWTPYWKDGRKMAAEEVARKEAENEAHREADHAKLRAAIVAWVRESGRRVLLCPEMTYEVPLLRPLLFDGLPDDVKPKVASLDRYWLTAEAAGVYARAAGLLSFEMHGPIIGVANGTPAVHVRQPTDTRKGRMWADVGLGDWLFEVEKADGPPIAEAVLGFARDPEAVRERVKQARAVVAERQAAMMRSVAAMLA